jgi:predicted nucleic acid-binding protein
VSDFVLDASVALALCFPDESTPGLIALQDSLAHRSAVVPPLWWTEMANALVVARRRTRINEDEFATVLHSIRQLPLQRDAATPEECFDRVITLAERHRLSAYDASYLELAARRDLPLATLDRDLARAAAGIGVPLEPV